MLFAVAHAEEWAPSAWTVGGDVHDVDLSTVTREGDVVHFWVRQTLVHQAKDALSGKDYLVAIQERFDDCVQRRFRSGTYVLRNHKGEVVNTVTAGTGWQALVPGSIAEALSKVACKATAPPEAKPFLSNIGEGNWMSVGLSADNKYTLSVRMDEIIRVDANQVVIFTRSDFKDYQYFDNYPVKYAISASGINCKTFQTADLGLDAYMSAKIVAVSRRVPPEKITYEPIHPGSFLASSFDRVCASAPAAPPPKGAEQPADAGKVGMGTAWASSKGYLITASHVIKDGQSIEVYSDGQRVGGATVVADDPANDLAVLKLTALGRTLYVLPLSERGTSLGRSVFTLGYPAPDLLGQSVKMTTGVISGASGFADDARVLQFSAPIQPGNSGGPLIGWDGTVVGVVDSTLRKFDDDKSEPAPEMVNFAVKASYVRALLEDLPDLGNHVAVKAVGGQDALVAAARKAVFMLIVTR